MSKTKKNRKYILAEGVNDSQCFSCGKNKNKNFERHHFPRSHVAGGETYVPLCGICHDMVDRYCLDDWQECLLDDIKDKLIHNLPILKLMCGMMSIVKKQDDAAIDSIYNLTEEDAWEIMKTCDGNMRTLALKVISLCFNEQYV